MTNPANQSSKDSMTPGEVSAALGLSVRQIARLADDGRFTARRIAGGHRRFDRKEIEALVEGKSS